jgi:hypothetical protein
VIDSVMRAGRYDLHHWLAKAKILVAIKFRVPANHKTKTVVAWKMTTELSFVPSGLATLLSLRWYWWTELSTEVTYCCCRKHRSTGVADRPTANETAWSRLKNNLA